MLELVIIAIGTALATGLGAVPVVLLGQRAEGLRPALLGLAAGVMSVAAVSGLLLPAVDDGSAAEVVLGLTAGVTFLLVARRMLSIGPAEAMTGARRTSLLVFAVLFIHSLPEGLAIGTAYASTTEGLAAFIVVAIAIQNVPEGTSVAIPMEAAGYRPWQLFWAAVGTSAPQPVGAVIAYLLVAEVSALLPISFAFAAGAMLALVLISVLPDAIRAGLRAALTGAGIGAAAMLALSSALGV